MAGELFKAMTGTDIPGGLDFGGGPRVGDHVVIIVRHVMTITKKRFSVRNAQKELAQSGLHSVWPE